MTGATHYIEQWKDKQGVYHFTKPKEVKEFNKALTKSRYGFKTIAVFRIKLKDTVNYQEWLNEVRQQEYDANRLQ